MEKEEKKLTDKERRFVDFYTTSANFNATLAHELAGYQASGNDARRAEASRLRSKPNIKAAINAVLEQEHKDNVELKAKIRRRYEAIAATTLDKIIQFRVDSVNETSADEGGNEVLTVHESHVFRVPSLDSISEENRVAIKKVKKMATGGYEVELYDAMQAMAELRKMCGFDEPEKSEVTQKVIRVAPPIKTNETHD